ncbi:MAG: AEC family transporter [Gammaproteobacteria bacterium]|nr:AEC family transporter [Gammaproteobacteria bacterium]
MKIFLLMLPIMLIILAGYLSARFSLLSHESNNHFTRFAFYVAMPCQLVFIFSKTPLAAVINIPYILTYASVFFISGTFVFCISKYILKKSLAESALNIMGSSLANTAYFAIPLFVLIFNDPAPVIPILIFQVVIVTTIVLILIEHDVNEKAVKKEGYYFNLLKKIFLILFKNPLIIASFFGVYFSFSHIYIPVVFNNFLNMMGETAAPLILFALGQSLYFDLKKIVKKELIEVGILVLIKLFILPLLALLIGKYVFKLNGFWLASLIIMAAMPSPKNMFIFSARYNLDVKKASTVIAVTTLLSFITLNCLFLLFHASLP